QQEAELMPSSESEEESEVEERVCGTQQEVQAADLHRHPQLDADIQAVRTFCPGAAVSVREYGSIDGVDVDLHINANSLDKEVREAWRIHPSEPIIIRLHFCCSQYVAGPAPSVEVFQPSNRDHFNLGKQLKNILTDFISRQWNRVTNESIRTQEKSRQSWFNLRGTIKKVHASPNVWVPQSKSGDLQEASRREKVTLPAMKWNCFTNHSTSYIIKNSTGELFTYTPSGKRVMISAVKSPAHLGTKQLVELLFSSQAIGHCKSTPTMEHGILVQIVRYAEQRIPTLSEYCVVCDEKHVFQSGPVLKPAVCSRELCVFSYHTLGVMSGVTEEVATGAEVVDLLVALCRAALQSPRKSIIFEPYPCVVDPNNPRTLAFSPKRKNYDRLQKALDSILLIRRMAQGPYSEIKMQMDKVDPLAHPLLQWILASNRSHIVKLPPNRLKFMHTPHQFLLICSPPFKEACFQAARKRYGSTFAFHGSHFENWHSILRNGLVNGSYTKLQLHGAAYGKGIYLSPVSSISFGYSEMGKGRHRMATKEELRSNGEPRSKQKQQQPCAARFLYNRNLNCIALCEVITSKHLQKHGNIWVCATPDHVCTRFLFVYENGQVGDAHINTQEAKIHHEIVQVVRSKFYMN
uniref:Poly [ADP-ribose] polymerase n=1 Tax=Tetraodon nigroviridis TaxID=99883 RepID=H3D873_TETNG